MLKRFCQRAFLPVAFGLSAVFLFLGMAYIWQGDLYFFTDVARDFLILDEISQKGIVLLGPRASGISGMFHGPAWAYLNFPAFWLGNGNPVFVGWFWVLLTVAFLLSSYFLIKKITNVKIAGLYLVLLSALIAPNIYTFYNPFGALFLMPLLIFSFYFYQKTLKSWYLCLHLLVVGMMVQFQLAIGGPVLILSTFLVWRNFYLRRNWRQWWCFLVLLIPLSTFILFELTHHFMQTQAVLAFFTNKTTAPSVSFISRLHQRFNLAFSYGWQLFPSKMANIFNILVSVAFGVYLFYSKNSQFTSKKIDQRYAGVFRLAAFYYFGFFIISLIFNGDLLPWYWLPFAPLSLLMVAIMAVTWKNLCFRLTVVAGIITSLIFCGNFYFQAPNNIGLIEDDWRFQQKIAETIIDDGETEFGYFIFTPDVYAYESKAAMNYYARIHPERQMTFYQKKPITYLIIAPNPDFRDDIDSFYWKKDKIHLDLEIEPVAVFELPAGYRIEKYELNAQELAVAPDQDLNDWLYFR